MKPARIKAERERLANIKFRQMIRRIPDNAALTNILLRFEEPFRSIWYHRAAPLLKFKAVPLETINVLRSQ